MVKKQIHNQNKQQLLKDNDPKEAMSQILTEENFLLIGATSFLGFQFSIVFNQNFLKFSSLIQYTHLISLYIIGIAVILLFVPITYHRIGAKGKHTENQPVFAHNIFKSALAMFAAGVSLEVFAALKVMTDSSLAAGILATVTLLLYVLFWFVLPI